jgi:hypothetical protein
MLCHRGRVIRLRFPQEFTHPAALRDHRTPLSSSLCLSLSRPQLSGFARDGQASFPDWNGLGPGCVIPFDADADASSVVPAPNNRRLHDPHALGVVFAVLLTPLLRGDCAWGGCGSPEMLATSAFPSQVTKLYEPVIFSRRHQRGCGRIAAFAIQPCYLPMEWRRLGRLCDSGRWIIKIPKSKSRLSQRRTPLFSAVALSTS